MSDLEKAFLNQRVGELEQQFKLAQQTIANHARNALVALDEDDTEEVRKILNALAGRDEDER